MTEITIGGPIESAVTHFCGFGLAALLESESGKTCWLRWTDEESPRLVVTTGLETRDATAAALHSAVLKRAADSWVTSTMSHEGGEGTGTFSPRIKAPSSGGSWHTVQRERHRGIDAAAASGGLLDLRMIGALGEPAYWAVRNNKVQPDSGASRLEMKARNRGEEFVGDRFSKMHVKVAAREPGDMLAGVEGEVKIDELGGRESQTATGMQLPGPVDAAQALVALWGISILPPIPRVNDVSATPGVQPQNRVHPRVLVLPVATRELTLDKIRALCSSRWLQFAAESIYGHSDVAPEIESSFREHGVDALIRFPIRTAGSSTAPQRFLLDGELIVWSGDGR